MAFKLESNEHIVLIARRHWFRPVLESLALLFSLLIPVFFTSIMFALPQISEDIGNVNILSIIILVSWFFVVWNFLFVIWTNHFLDVLIVTNLHVIDIEQISLWHREISTVQLQKVQDIQTTIDGLVQSVLDYGTLEIQSAGSMTNFVVHRVQKPNLIRQKINEQMSQTHRF